MSRPEYLKRWFLGAGLFILGFAWALLAVEGLLSILDLPRFYQDRSRPPQKHFPAEQNGYRYFVNRISEGIEFIYDGNLRGYFGPRNEVVHHTNSWGFRGQEFSRDKSPRVFRIACIGDSFTFGEGVRDEDTYCEQLEKILQSQYPKNTVTFEAYNFGVSGLNAEEIIKLFEDQVVPVHPDAVIYGYHLNDAEPPLFYKDPLTGEIKRGPHRKKTPDFVPDFMIPRTFLYRFRLVRLLWQARQNAVFSKRNQDPYQTLYAEGSPDWNRTRGCLRAFTELCKKNALSCTVMCFPILHSLNFRYPYAEIHEKVRREVLEGSASQDGGRWVKWIDLFPYLEGQKAPYLWVHPTDHHPNEIVHRMAAQVLAEAFLADDHFLKN